MYIYIFFLFCLCNIEKYKYCKYYTLYDCIIYYNLIRFYEIKVKKKHIHIYIQYAVEITLNYGEYAAQGLLH